MNFFPKLAVSLIIAAIATVLVTKLNLHGAVPLGITFAVVAVLASLLGDIRLPLPDHGTAGAGQRERGKVKWFNSNKGFGFIIRENGEEIFVHSRSITGSGKGRRSLRDGQPVSFVVRDSNKGPQAEEVEAH